MLPYGKVLLQQARGEAWLFQTLSDRHLIDYMSIDSYGRGQQVQLTH